MKLRLVEQACGCSTVQGGGALKVRACLVCLWHLGGEWLPLGASGIMQVFAFATEPP